MGRANGRKKNHHDGRSDYMPGPRTRTDNHERGMELSKKAEVLGTEATSKRSLQLFGKRQNEQKSWRKLDTDHQRGQNYEHCSRSVVPGELKERQRCLPLLFSSRRDKEIYYSGGERRTNGSNMGEPIRTRKEKLAGRVENHARRRVVQVKKRGGGSPLI